MARMRLLAGPVALAMLFVCSLMAVVAVKGMVVSGDGNSYIDVATDIREGRGFSDPGFEDAVHFPPGTSIAIATVGLSGLSSPDAATALNFATWLGAVAAGAALYLSVGGRRSWPGWLVLGWVGGGAAFAYVFSSVLSDGLFLAISLAAALMGERWVRRPTTWGAAWVITLCASAVAVRYVGVALIAAIGVRILQERWSLRRTLAALAAIGAAVLPVGLWVLRYRGISGARPDGFSGWSFRMQGIYDSLAALASLFIGGVPYSEDETIVAGPIDMLLRPSLAVVGLGLIIGAAYLALRAIKGAGSPASVGLEKARASGGLLAFDYAALSMIVLALWRITRGRYILARYWLPAIVPLVIVGAAWLSHEDRSVPRKIRRVLPAAAAVLVATNIVVSFALLVR